MEKRMLRLATLVLSLLPAFAQAQGLILVDPSDGKYLGNLNANRYDPNSVSNPYGQYGSRYSPDSINNPYGQYGSRYSPKSATNPYATQAPVIVDPSAGNGGYGGYSGYSGYGN